MRRLEGLVALIAGGAGGIGGATCRRLAAEGARLCIGDIREDAAQAIACGIVEEGGEAIACHLDLGDHASIEAAFALAGARLGPVRRLHCNGAALDLAYGSDFDALDIALETWTRTLHVNLTGFLVCIRHALPTMLDARDGAIVATSSGAAWVPEDVRVAYGVSKAGINHLIRHVAHRWGKQGIRANAVAPGIVTSGATLTSPNRQRLLDIGRSPRLGEPDDVAAMVAMLMSDDGSFINGQVLAVDGGLTLRP